MNVQTYPNPDNAEKLDTVVLTLLDHLNDMVAYWDIQQVCVYANRTYRLWFGKILEELLEMRLSDLLEPFYTKNLPYIQAAYEGFPQNFESGKTSPDGQTRHSLTIYTPYISRAQLLGLFIHIMDVTPQTLQHKLLRAKADAKKLASHDFLTGLPNRMLLMYIIFQAVAHAKRTRRRVA